MKNYKLVFIILLLLSSSCKKETVVSTIEENIVPVDVDLQTGFEDKSIRVYFDQQVSFQAILSGLVPFSGPIAKFSTQLERSSHSLKVRWQSSNSGIAFKIDSTVITLGNVAKYYIGLEIINDSLKTKVQDIPFGYL
jgi:hypothetical protein